MCKDHRAIGRLAVLLLAVSAAATVQAAAPARYGDVVVQISTTGSGESNFGYVEYQATISNSGTAARVVKLVMPEQAFGYGQYIQELSRTVTVGPGSAAMVSLFQPPLQMQGSGVLVVIDGRRQRESIHLASVNHCSSYYMNNQSCCVLVSQQVGYDDVHNGSEAVFKEAASSRYSSQQETLSLALAEVPAASWSRNWLSYSRYNGILMTGYEWKTLPPEVRTALLEYVRCGGSLSVVGDAQWDPSITAFGTVQEGIFQTYYPGFGAFRLTDRADLKQWQQADWQILKDTWRSSSRNLAQHKGVKEANDWFPVVENLSIPVRGLLLIILVFAILMGPANLFILSRKKRQIWLLWTVPVLSLTASIIIFGYATLAEGWKGYSRTLALTVLDEKANLASTIGITAFYCPLNPREGLHFDYETECTAQVERYSGDNTRGRSIDWTEDQHLKSGWIASRIPAHFKLRKSQMRREKMIFTHTAPQQCQALNGFGVLVEKLVYADAAGNLYSAQNIEPGAKIQLQPLDQPRLNGPQDPRMARDKFQADWPAGAKEMMDDPAKFLQPNCYIAIVKEPLFIEKALQKPMSEVFESVIYGISEGASNAG